MRVILILSMFAVSYAYADSDYYKAERSLEMDAQGLSGLDVESHAGSLEIVGEKGLDRIYVTAIVGVPTSDDERAEKIITADLVFTLVRDGDEAVLKGYFRQSFWQMGDSPHVRMEIRVPSHLALKVEDSSGSIKVSDVAGDIEIDDSSGSIRMDDVGGSIDIKDSSGSITVAGVGESISIEDGSGSINVRDVGGSVSIDDGSGSITVRNVEQDLIILSDGSGSLNYSDIHGSVEER